MFRALYMSTRTHSACLGVGSSISVIGATQNANGTLTASFTVDGQKPVTFNPFDGSQNVNTTQWAVSQTLFHQDVTPGAHQLTVTLDAVTGAQVRMTISPTHQLLKN